MKGELVKSATGVNLWDLKRFAHGREYEMLRPLQQTHPVFWHDRPGGEAFWAITGYTEARAVLRDPATFSSATSHGGMVLQSSQATRPELDGVWGPMIETDPPRHQPQRRAISPAFTPRSIAALETRIRKVAAACIERAAALEEFDFVAEIAHVIPSSITLSLLGVPEADWAMLADLEHRALTSADPDYDAGDSGVATMNDAFFALGAYFFELLTDKASTGGDDLLVRMLNVPVQGKPRTALDVTAEAVLLLNGGLDTTRAAASAGGLLPLLERPDQYRRLREDPGCSPRRSMTSCAGPAPFATLLVPPPQTP